MIEKLRSTYSRFPEKFWIVVGAGFIDNIGSTLLFPFFALYITQRFGVGMTEAGYVLGLNSLCGLFGSVVGGAVTDKFGRRSIILFGLVFSAISTLSLGFISRYAILLPFSALIGFLGSIAHPAHIAMVTDLLPEEKRTEGFGIQRVADNLSWIIGPTIGGLIAGRGFIYLFITDAVISCLVAFIFYKMIPETMPARTSAQARQSIASTFRGYIKVLSDRPFVAYLLVSLLCLLVYLQMYSTLSVYMRDVNGFPARYYGYLLSLGGVMVVLAQLWITERTRKKPPFLMMAAGTLFYAIGFTMFGLFRAFIFFVAAITIIMIGEMILIPVSQALAAKFAPEDMRGRYMAAFGLSWSIPSTIGPSAAGFILDNFNPASIWYLGGGILLISATGYLGLHSALRGQERFSSLDEAEEPATA